MIVLWYYLGIFVISFYWSNAAHMEEVISWKQVEYNWPSDDLKHKAISAGAYIRGNNVPLGIARWKNKLFVSLNRWKSGVASTLNYVEIGEDKSPKLTPYPSWESNLILNVSKISDDPLKKPIVSVFRVWVDVCDRLWVLDDGVDNLFGGPRTIIDRSLLVFDLNTDELLRRYYFKRSDVLKNSVFGNIVVDTTSDSCDDAFAYVADFSGSGLVVYSFSSNTSWRVRHLYMMPDPLAGTFKVGGVTAHWIDGILGLAMTQLKANGYRTLYFHSLTSKTQFHVSTEVLQNQTWANNPAAFDDYKISGYRGSNSQATTNGYDEKTGVIFYTQPNRNGVSCWNTNNPISSHSLVETNETTLEFPADLKMDRDRNIWIISNRLPKYLYGSHNEDEVNIRIFKISVDNAIKNTACEKILKNVHRQEAQNNSILSKKNLDSVQRNHTVGMDEVFSWKQIQFKWASEEQKSKAISTGTYIPENNIPLGIVRWKSKLFITVTRLKSGVASTLNYVEIGEDKSPLFIPFPSWESNLIWDGFEISSDPLKKPIVSAYRAVVDVCDRLWVLDNGVDSIFGGDKTVIDKSIVIFDLNTDKLLKRHYFKSSDVLDSSVFGNIVIDTTPDTCNDAFAYVADFGGFGLVVYSFSANTSWRIRHLYMMPDPLAGAFKVGPKTAYWVYGVQGLTLSNVKSNGYRTLYFSPLTSTTQFQVSTEVIKNQTWAQSDTGFDDYKVTGNRGSNSQSTNCVFDDKTGVIFYTQPNRNGISCWNTNSPLNSFTDLVIKNEKSLEFPADLRVDADRNVWMISNRLPKYIYGSHHKNEDNIRIFKIGVDDAIHNTACEKLESYIL